MKLAPWWAYLVPFLALNYARAELVDTSGAGDIALALATAALVFATVHDAPPRPGLTVPRVGSPERAGERDRVALTITA